MPKTKEIIISGRSFILSERTARNVNKLISFSLQKVEKNYTDFIIESAVTLADGLEINFINLSFWQWFKKRKLRKFLSSENLMSVLPASELFALAKQVYELEGILQDEKKKTVEKTEESVVPLQSV